MLHNTFYSPDHSVRLLLSSISSWTSSQEVARQAATPEEKNPEHQQGRRNVAQKRSGQSSLPSRNKYDRSLVAALLPRSSVWSFDLHRIIIIISSAVKQTDRLAPPASVHRLMTTTRQKNRNGTSKSGVFKRTHLSSHSKWNILIIHWISAIVTQYDINWRLLF